MNIYIHNAFINRIKLLNFEKYLFAPEFYPLKAIHFDLNRNLSYVKLYSENVYDYSNMLTIYHTHGTHDNKINYLNIELIYKYVVFNNAFNQSGQLHLNHKNNEYKISLTNTANLFTLHIDDFKNFIQNNIKNDFIEDLYYQQINIKRFIDTTCYYLTYNKKHNSYTFSIKMHPYFTYEYYEYVMNILTKKIQTYIDNCLYM
jgi:hypothetical protein